MADTFKGIITADGKKRQLPYRNVIETPVSDETLSIQGAFADAKVVGDNFKKTKAETDSLKEDLSNKITKFYASSQGETHLADSDNGKIMDMMLYGRSEQKQYSGKNLLNPTLQTTTRNGVTCTANGDGTYTLNGTATTITTFDIAQDVSCSSFRLVGCPVGGAHDVSYELQARTNNLIYGYDTGDGKNIKADENFFIKIRINAGINCNNLLFKPMIVDDSLYPDATYDDFEPYHEQTVTLPYTLNAIPVESGGNVTIDGQQYIADYVDVERGKLVRMVANNRLLSSYNWNTANEYYWGSVSAATNGKTPITADNSKKMCACKYLFASSTYDVRAKKSGIAINNIKQVVIGLNYFASADDLKTFLANNDVRLVYPLEVPTETDLTPEEITAFKALATYYPTTNISANSEQLDGYTVFNYPISMANGWNYVKQQIGDTRDYIYDMDARTQDTDLQAAEAYVNSEYAVALTELEV